MGEFGFSIISRNFALTSASYTGLCVFGYGLFLRVRISSGKIPRAASRKIFFEIFPLFFISQGIFQTYSTSLWSQNGTLTSSPDAILILSLRSRRFVINHLILSHEISLRRDSSLFSPRSLGVFKMLSLYLSYE